MAIHIHLTRKAKDALPAGYDGTIKFEGPDAHYSYTAEVKGEKKQFTTMSAAKAFMKSKGMVEVADHSGFVFFRLANKAKDARTDRKAYSEGQAAAAARDATQPSIGEKVMCNGYPGVIRKVHTGQLSGMVDVKLESGTVTVEHSSLKPVRDADSIKPGDKVHMGHVTAGGSGAKGTVEKIEGETVYIKNNEGLTFRGQLKNTTKDSVESVEKEIATQQRLIDTAKKAGKDVPAQVTQRMRFLKEELEKAKNPRTDDASPAEVLSDLAEAGRKLATIQSAIKSGDFPTASAAAKNLARIAEGLAADLKAMK